MRIFQKWEEVAVERIKAGESFEQVARDYGFVWEDEERRHFAAMAMQAILSNPGFNTLPAPADHFKKSSTEMDCIVAVEYADSLVAELEKKKD
jgi:hypothetical protein